MNDLSLLNFSINTIQDRIIIVSTFDYNNICTIYAIDKQQNFVIIRVKIKQDFSPDIFIRKKKYV